jgi:hypothetical protein
MPSLHACSARLHPPLPYEIPGVRVVCSFSPPPPPRASPHPRSVEDWLGNQLGHRPFVPEPEVELATGRGNSDRAPSADASEASSKTKRIPGWEDSDDRPPVIARLGLTMIHAFQFYAAGSDH